MRKFIISDIHGLGNIYYSVMGYLDNISKNEEIELYVNGDLIDRGPDSALILLDIKKRIEENKFKIVYLGGNHELLMYETFEARKMFKYSIELYNWYRDGGRITDNGLTELLGNRDKILEVASFVGNLKIYHKFYEKINDKNIVLVHASSPLEINDECNLRLKDDGIFYYVWAREEDPNMPFRCRIGNEDYFTIVGHTLNMNKYGYEYHHRGNYLNIDGGCNAYARGYFEVDHVPLVEVYDGYLKIFTFNNNNEIIYGNYFDGVGSIPMTPAELNKERSYLNKEFKPKTLIKYANGKVKYEE